VWPGVGVGGGSSENEDDEQLWLEWNSTTTQRIVEFPNNLFENEEYGETVAGVTSTTTQRRKDDRKNNNGRELSNFRKNCSKMRSTAKLWLE